MPLAPRQATVNPRLCWSLLDTHRQVWLSLFWGHGSFFLSPGAHKVLFVPSQSLFPQSCGSSIIKFCWPSKSNSWGFSVPLWDLQVGQSVTGHRTFATVEELLWYSCSPICESPAQQLDSGAISDLLQEDLGHVPRLPDLLHQSPCPCAGHCRPVPP